MCMYTFGLMVCRGILRSYSKVVIFIFTYAIRANLQLSWGFDSNTLRNIPNTTLCDKM